MSVQCRNRDENAEQVRHLEALRQATGAIAHGLNNRLTAIAGFLELARDTVQAGRSPSDDLESAVDVVMSSADQVAKLLAFASRGSLVTTIRDLARLMHAMSEPLGVVLGENIQLEHALHPKTGAVAVDLDAFQDVLTALAANAREAMPAGGVLTITAGATRLSEPTCRQRFPMLQPGRYAEVTLTDTGPGMVDEIRRRCFDPYFSTKETSRNVGLGLSSCYGIMRQLGGMIEIESAPEQGTLVRLLLPQVISS